MKPPTRIALACLGLAAACTATAATAIDDAREQLDQWVETRQLISKERADWSVEREILEETRVLLKNEITRLTDALTELEEQSTVADEDRAKLSEEKERLSEGTTVVESNLVALETRLKAIVARFPEPLVDKIKPVLRRLPDDPEDTTMTIGERVQNIVVILSQADQFNNTINRVSSIETMDDGKEVQVDTLYWGLAMAYFVDASGSHAGIRTPGPGGWTSTVVPGAGPQIKQLVDVYEGVGEIQFVDVPAKIQQ